MSNSKLEKERTNIKERQEIRKEGINKPKERKRRLT